MGYNTAIMGKTFGRRLFAAPLLLLMLLASCLPSQGVDRMAAPYGEDTLGQHVETLVQRIGQRLQSPPGGDLSTEQEVGLVDEYFSLTAQISRLSRELMAGRRLEDWTTRALSEQLDWARQRRESLKTGVEAIIGRQVGEALRQAGLGASLGPQESGWFFPPSEFFLLKPPFVLVTSPKERIEISSSYVLSPQLSKDTIEAIEKSVEAEGVSALVEVTGGFSLYPAWVSEDDSLRRTLQVAAHEWSHAYLFLFSALGRAYFQDHQMRTINETVADIIGREIGQQVYRRYYAPVEQPAALAAVTAMRERELDFGRLMRGIRGSVEEMLAQGRVVEAEAVMETERGRLSDRGFYVRRLNQAYLALHSSYADSPGFESPIGTALQELRARSPSLGDFVSRVGSVSTYADFERLVE